MYYKHYNVGSRPRRRPGAANAHVIFFWRISHMTVSTRWPKPKCTIPAWPRPKENCGLLALDHLKHMLAKQVSIIDTV